MFKDLLQLRVKLLQAASASSLQQLYLLEVVTVKEAETAATTTCNTLAEELFSL